MTTTVLGTSNVRGGPSRYTRTNPARASKGVGPTLPRQNSLVSNHGLTLPTSSTAFAAQPTTPYESHGMYPAITHFADAISALPREFRRHTSLLKEVDAKAWGPEESVQHILDQCNADAATIPGPGAASAQALTASSIVDDLPISSEVNSVAGASFDNASLASARSADPVIVHRRQQYHTLRQALSAIMVTMDEKNHVINNANEEIARHARRLDHLWPHVTDEVSEEARLGSLRHWAYTEMNPTAKKSTAPATRKEVVGGLGALQESDAAHRSQDRREAVRRQRAAVHHADSDFDDSRPPVRKTTGNGKRRAAEAITDPAGLGISTVGTGKRKKLEKSGLGGVAMERSVSSALSGRPMSRESSQQDNSKKRKASATAMSFARKRINAATQDSPKLASSPLAGPAGKDTYKRSPALSSVRPATNRGRQNSTNTIDSAKGSGRPSSLMSNRNGNNSNVITSTELSTAAAAASKARSEVESNRKEIKTDKSDPTTEDELGGVNGPVGDSAMSGALPSDRAKETGRAESRDDASTKVAASPRLPSLQTDVLKNERIGRGRTSKTSTPVGSTFADADASESTSANGNASSKPKRPPRSRVKDHGLHDSLSPKGLPMKRMHKKSGSLSFPSTASTTSTTQRMKDDADVPTKSSTPSERDVITNSQHAEDVDLVGASTGADADDEERDAGEEDEERYCYCNGVSYGEMVACDHDDCPRQWFHLGCIGLKSVPKSAKWYCDECKDVLGKGGDKSNVSKVKNTNGNNSGSVGGNGGGSSGNGHSRT